MDRPPGYVLPDQALIEVARRAPGDRAGLEHIRGLPAQTLHRRPDELLAAIARGRERSAPPAPLDPPARDPADAPLVSLAQALVRHRSMEEGVAVELIATQSELAALVTALRRGRDGYQVRVLNGWRRELVGAELCELVAGPGGAERRQRRRAERQPDLSPAGSTPSSIRRRMSPARRELRETWRCPTLGFCTSRPAASSSSPSS